MKIKIEDIRRLCTESSFERGMDYFRQGYVGNLEQFGNTITANIAGTSDYKVTIHIDEEDIEAACTCPYDWGGYCKHIVATLITLSENYDSIQQNKEDQEEKIENIFASISLDKIKVFLLKEFERDSSLRDHFTIYFSGTGSKEKSLYDYKREIDLLYGETADRNGFIKYGTYVNFSCIYDLADRFTGAGNIVETITIYQALSEVIAENMEWVDDSDGYYGDEFSMALEYFADSINKVKFKHKDKKYYINYLFDKYIENDPDYFQEYFYHALKEVCKSKNDLFYWKGLLEPYLPMDLPDHNQWSEYCQAKELLMMQLHILDSLDDEKAFYDLIKRYYCKDYEFCLLYVNCLEKDDRNKKAIKVAEKGLSLFPDHLTKGLRRFLNRFYEKHSPEEYKGNLLALFMQDLEWDDYKSLKKLCSKEEWGKVFSEIINKLSKSEFPHKDTIISIYLKEGLFEQAFDKVIKERSLYTLSEYYEDLSIRFPKMYFETYKELIIPFADSKVGRAHYQKIVKYLRQMKKIKGFEEEFMKLVKQLKDKYSNRSAFIDEMESI